MKRKYKDRRRQKTDARTVHTKDSFQNPLTRSGVFMPNALEATQYPLTRFTWDWQTINSLYRSHWIVRRIIDTIPADMVKNGYKILSQMAPDAIQKIQKTEKRTRTTAKILEGMKLGRLYGGAGALIMIKGQYDELDQPLELDSIMPGDYKGLLVLDRWSGITPEMELVNDLDDPEFGLPNFYRVSSDSLDIGVKVHHSRIIRFMGRPLPYIEQLAETYWGASELEHVIDELRKRDNVSWNIAMLTFMANLRVMKMEGMSQILATGSQQAQQDLYNVIQGMNAMMNNNSLQILGENDSFETHQYTFGGIADTYDRFMMDVAGAAETPVTKLFGRSPSGMNATGESDMQNYYDTIEEKQESELRPIYDKILPIMCMSTLGVVPDDLDYDFNAVRRPDEDEMSDLASKNTDSVTKAFQAGLISQRTALKELRSQSEITGMWTNITDEDIEKADDTIQDPNEGMPGMGGMFDAPGGDGNGHEDGESQKHDKPQEPGKPAHKEVPKSTMDAARKDKGTWVTINGSKVLVKNNIVVGGAGGKLNGMRVDESKTAGNNCDKNNGRIIHIGFNENKPLFRPESTTPGHDSHHANHAIKMGLTIKQWLAKGAKILNEEPAPYYLDWTEEGKEGEPDIYYRFNKKNRNLVVGTGEGTINTYFTLDKEKKKKYIPSQLIALLKK